MEASQNQAIVVPTEKDSNPFKRLPEEIVISHILNQISDVKSLCQISTVSKYFADLVPKTEYASVKLPGHSCSFEKFNEVMRGLTSPRRRSVLLMDLNLVWVSSWWIYIQGKFAWSSTDPVTTFLGKFKCLRSLSWEYDCPERGLAFGPVYRWKMMVTPNKSVCIVLLTAGSIDYDVTTSSSGCTDHDDLNEELIAKLESSWIFRSPMFSTKLFFWENMPGSLQRHVLVVNSKKQGKVDIQRSDLVERREQVTGDLWHRMRFWHSGVVQLPSSGCVMKKVTLHLIQESTSQVEDDVFLMAKQAFDGEDEEVFVEAALAMLKKNAILDSLLS